LPFIREFKETESYDPLKKLAWKTVFGNTIDVIIFILMAIITIYSICYLIFRGIKRA